MMQEISSFFRRHLSVERHYIVNKFWKNKFRMYAILRSNPDRLKNLTNFSEVEHQYRRFKNMKSVVSEIQKNEIDGDFVEFGTFQGLGICLLDLCFTSPTDRKIIGIDSFEGLPHSSTIWRKHKFNETSVESTNEFLKDRIVNFKTFKLIKGWFNEPFVKDELFSSCNKIALVHFDADLKTSTHEALTLITPYLVKNMGKPTYLLFDDWGSHHLEVPDAFEEWRKDLNKKFDYQFETLATSNSTRYIKFQLIKEK
jgi:hypothetical protein